MPVPACLGKVRAAGRLVRVRTEKRRAPVTALLGGDRIEGPHAGGALRVRLAIKVRGGRMYNACAPSEGRRRAAPGRDQRIGDAGPPRRARSVNRACVLALGLKAARARVACASGSSIGAAPPRSTRGPSVGGGSRCSWRWRCPGCCCRRRRRRAHAILLGLRLRAVGLLDDRLRSRGRKLAGKLLAAAYVSPARRSTPHAAALNPLVSEAAVPVDDAWIGPLNR